MGSTQDVRRAQNLWYRLSSYSQQRIEAAYVRCMVVKAELVVDDGVVGVICFEQML
jgi:hypothetical protein